MQADRILMGGALRRAPLACGLLAVGLAAVVACGGGGEDPPAPPAPLQVAVPAAWPYAAWLPGFADPFAEALELYAAEHAPAAVVAPWLEPDVATASYAALEAESPPDLLVVEPASLPALVAGDRLLALDEWAADHPALLEDLPAEVLDRFRVDGPLYAIPLGAYRGHASLAFAVSAHAAAAGRDGLALALLAQVRARAPRRDLPDLAVTQLRVLPPNPDLVGEEHGVLEVLVANLGPVTAPASRLDLHVDDDPAFASYDVPSLAPLDEFEARAGLPAPTLDRHVLHARLDADGLIPEQQEANNAAVDDWIVVPFAGGTKPPVVSLTGGPTLIDGSATRASAVGGGPKVAFDGTNYLVVWAKQTTLSSKGFHQDLRAVRVSPQGVVLDSGAGLNVTPGAGYYPWFDVAFGGGSYLVVWENGSYVEPGGAFNPKSRVQGRRISPAGQLLDPVPLDVDATAGPGPGGPIHTSVAVCFDGQDFLVFDRTRGHSSGGDGVWMQAVTPAGAIQGARQKAIDPGTRLVLYGALSAAFTGTRGYLAYSGAEVTHLTGGGERVDARFTACTDLPPPPPGAVGLAYTINSSAGGNLWTDGVVVSVANASSFAFAYDRRNVALQAILPRVHTATLTHPPGSVGNPGLILPTRYDRAPRIDYDGTHHLLAWVRGHGCHSYAALCRVSPGGTLGDTLRVDSPQADLVAHVDVACGTTNACVVYSTWRPASSLGAPEGHHATGFFLVNQPN